MRSLDQCYIIQPDGSVLDARTVAMQPAADGRPKLNLLAHYRAMVRTEQMKKNVKAMNRSYFEWNYSMGQFLEQLYSERLLGHMQLWQRSSEDTYVHPKYAVDALGMFVEIVPRAVQEAQLLMGRLKATQVTLESMTQKVNDLTEQRDKLREENKRLRKNQEEQAGFINSAEAQLKLLNRDLKSANIIANTPEVAGSSGEELPALRRITACLMDVEAAIEHCHLLCLIEHSPDAIADVDMMLQTEEVLNLFESCSTQTAKYCTSCGANFDVGCQCKKGRRRTHEPCKGRAVC